MAEQELKQLREKLEKQEQQFQNYRDECKALESFLEEESNKKQKEIRKLKEEAITKEKSYKFMKIENTQLLSEITTLRTELEKKANYKDSTIVEQHLKNIQNELQIKLKELKDSLQKIADCNQKIETMTNEISQLNNKIEQKNQLTNQYEARINNLEEVIHKQKKQNEELFDQNKELTKLQTSSKQTVKDQVTVRKTRVRDQTAHLEYQLNQTKAKHEEKVSRYEEKIAKMEKTIKQLRQRLQETQQSQLSSMGRQVMQKNIDFVFKMYIGCLIMTKPHYLSPFLDVNQQTKTVKLFKPARNGCFEKSLGSTRHKFSILTYNKTQIVEDIVNKIKNYDIDSHHLVLIYGTKKSAKKNLFDEIMTQLFDFISEKIKDYEHSDCSAVYVRKAYDEPCQTEEAYSLEEITSLLKKLTNSSGSVLRRNERSFSGRKAEKPRVAYFSLSIGQFMIEIATSSFTNIFLKEKDDASTFYNNVLYSKLPNILQSTYGEKYLVFTLNPIVDLYEQCKNILSVTACKSLLMSPSKQDRELDSPNKQLLNTAVRRKLQSYERQIEQGQLRIRKVEEECGYYRIKFSELQQRLKNLISTHHSQNSYLKKSPILLSYEKMLKFIHSVQSKNSQNEQIMGNVINLDGIDFNGIDQNQECL